MRPSASGSDQAASRLTLASSSAKSGTSSGSWLRFGQPKRLSLACVCMARCSAAPSEAFAHSLGILVRGAHSAMSADALVPQANSRRAVPVIRKKRPARKEAAAAGSTPMTCAPAMKKSPRMPPRPFGSGQLFGWGRAERAAASSKTAIGQTNSRARRRSGTVRQTKCHPQAASGRKSTIEARPRDWTARSATTAPQWPKRLRGAACVALLKLGSYTDQVARLVQAAPAAAMKTRP